MSSATGCCVSPFKLLLVLAVAILALDFVNNCVAQGMDVLATHEHIVRRKRRGCSDEDTRLEKAWVDVKASLGRLVPGGRNKKHPCEEHFKASMNEESGNRLLVAVLGMNWSRAVGDTLVGLILAWMPKAVEMVAQSVSLAWSELPYAVKLLLLPLALVLFLLGMLVDRLTRIGFRVRVPGFAFEVGPTHSPEDMLLLRNELTEIKALVCGRQLEWIDGNNAVDWIKKLE